MSSHPFPVPCDSLHSAWILVSFTWFAAAFVFHPQVPCLPLSVTLWWSFHTAPAIYLWAFVTPTNLFSSGQAVLTAYTLCSLPLWLIHSTLTMHQTSFQLPQKEQTNKE
jgi:hypothetical protein